MIKKPFETLVIYLNKIIIDELNWFKMIFLGNNSYKGNNFILSSIY
jgi:hypothetical protein